MHGCGPGTCRGGEPPSPVVWVTQVTRRETRRRRSGVGCRGVVTQETSPPFVSGGPEGFRSRVPRSSVSWDIFSQRTELYFPPCVKVGG